jgi:hypothetical protein
MCEERHRRTWETQLVPRKVEVSETDQKIGELKMSWESDQLVVLGGRESRSQGEGAEVNTKPAKETLTEHEETDDSANLPVGNSKQGEE